MERTNALETQHYDVVLPAETTGTLMASVVSPAHGFGHGKAGVRLGVISAHAGASRSALTDPEHLDELTGNTAASGVAVTVRPTGAVGERGGLS